MTAAPAVGGGSALELHLRDDADPQAVMSAALAAVPLRRAELRRATLEDVFVDLVDTTDSEDAVRASVSEGPPSP